MRPYPDPYDKVESELVSRAIYYGVIALVGGICAMLTIWGVGL